LSTNNVECEAPRPEGEGVLAKQGGGILFDKVLALL
jgi:hypothetical protein